MQTSVESACTLSFAPPPTMQLSWPESVMSSTPALPRMRVCEILFEKVPDPLRSAVTPSELQPAGVSWENCRAFNDVPTWLTGTLVLAVKLVTSVAATISVRSPAPLRPTTPRRSARRPPGRLLGVPWHRAWRWCVKGTKISIRRLIRSNVRRCAASSHHGRKGVGVRSSVPRFLHLVAPRVGYDFDGNTRSLIIA
jgi:hypothetical protein